MELREYRPSDEEVCAPWFVDNRFMPPKWLENALPAARDSENHRVIVACEGGKPVSIFSFARLPGEDWAIVSLMVSRDLRRVGKGRATLEAIRDAFPDVNEFVAYVDPTNAPSKGLMEASGLVLAPIKDGDKELYVWRRDREPLPADWKPPPSVPRY